MSTGEKKGLFGRWFGPDGSDAKEEAGEIEQAAVVDEGDAAGDDAPPADAASIEGARERDEPSLLVEDIASDNDLSLESDLASENDQSGGEELGWFSRLAKGLTKSSQKLSSGITGIFTKRKLDDEALEELEDLLIQSDLGVAMAVRITERLAETRYDKEITDDEVRAVLVEEVRTILAPVAKPLEIDAGNQPHILLMVGVNGAGKTTTIGKLAQKFTGEGKSVMLAAGDTFRAAAIDQLKVWGERTDVPVIARDVGGDASGLVFEALEAAKAQKIDVLMIDTAGRLQNKTELMSELEKIVRVIKKQDPTGPHDVILTLDATTGQNALNQVEVFSQSAGVSGLVMTKLDGSARGGILVAVADKFQLPVHAIGVGEGVEDMQAFDPDEFAKAMVGGDAAQGSS